jgi:hypothetical protein
MARAAPEKFINWIISLAETPALLLEVSEGRLLACSPALADLAAAREGGPDLAVVGEESSTALALSLNRDGETLRAWLRVPLDTEAPDGQLLLLFLLSPDPQPLDLATRLRAAYAERESRHSINQPLTAITFLVENLLFACLGGEADGAYLDRKQAQMLGELRRLRGLLERYEVLPGLTAN